jgi:hypothetical protein
VLDNLQGTDPEAYRHMQITEIGRACGAKVVVYMNLNSANIDSPQGGSVARGELLGYLKVIDCSTGETRWPVGDTKGWQVAITTPWEQTPNSAAQVKLREELVQNTATLVSQVFYDHVSDRPLDEGAPVDQGPPMQ